LSKLWFWLPLIANATAVFIIGADRKNWPQEAYWDNRVVIGSLATTVLIPVIQAFISERGEKARRLALQRENTVRDALAGTLVALATYCGADWRTTSVQAFIVKRRGLRWPIWKSFEQTQVRLAKVRLASAAASGITWTENKGLIGRCWSMKAPQWKWLNMEFAPFAKLTKHEWQNISTERVYGLTFEEFQSVRDKYGLVAAVPIIDESNKYIGCITMDTPPSDPPPQIDKTRAMEFLASTAKVVKDLLAQPR